MIQIHAPYPDVEAIIFLPKPELGDTETPQSRINVLKDMNGGLHTHKTQKQPNNRKYLYSFNLTRMKALELLEFTKLYSGKPMKIVWVGVNERVVHMLFNPLELNIDGRAVVADSDERVLVELEFESVE